MLIADKLKKQPELILDFYGSTVNSLIATTSRKRPPRVRDHFVNNGFVSQSNTVPRALS